MPKIRVLVVDDAVIIRRIISEVVSSDPELELAGWAANGKFALAKIPQLKPDCITLDVDMPEMDGMKTLTEIRKNHPRLPVIMVSALTERGASKTLEALSLGATDYVTKPVNIGGVDECIMRLREDLVPKIKAYARIANPGVEPTVAKLPVKNRKNAAKPSGRRIDVLCIASSTGGPTALSTLIPMLPAHMPVPIVIVQHMPPMFTAIFSKRLNGESSLSVEEGEEGREIKPGSVYIAPGGRHMEVTSATGKVLLHLNDKPPENSCRPAADVLFRSVVRVYGASILGVVLTGMGQDGLIGCQHIVESGGRVLAQDRATSVVWGMPGFVAGAGLPEEVLPIQDMASAIMSRM